MYLLLEGILWGFGLSFLIGPIFFALIQAGIERGFKAAIVMCWGVWFSDFIYILLTYTGVSYITAWISDPNFKHIVGMIGAAILVFSGLATLLSKAPQLDKVYHELEASGETQLPYLSLFVKGYLVNTFNPFTVFFWIGLNTTMATRGSFTTWEALLFFSGLWGMIIFTDVIKCYLAKILKEILKPLYVLWLRRGCAVAMIISGIILLFRTLYT